MKFLHQLFIVLEFFVWLVGTIFVFCMNILPAAHSYVSWLIAASRVARKGFLTQLYGILEWSF